MDYFTYNSNSKVQQHYNKQAAKQQQPKEVRSERVANMLLVKTAKSNKRYS